MRTFVYIVSLVLFITCTDRPKRDMHSKHAHEDDTRYTCPMHPQIVQNKSGICPVCGMDLVMITKSDAAVNSIMLTGGQIKLANINTQKARIKPIGQTIIINGRLEVDERQSEVVSARASGRIEKLYVKETGQTIKKGMPLYILYSETLLTLQQEYLLAKEQYESLGKTETRYQSFLKSAEKKLLLYGISARQIALLTDSKSLQPHITFLAPATGVVTEINVIDGQYVSEGSLLYKIEDINKLWLEAELYPGETSLVKSGDSILVRITGEEANDIEARVTFLRPEYSANTQITIMRASIQNPRLTLKPGQQVQVVLTHSARNAISLPTDAVIRNGKGTHVYVQAGNNTFRPRIVKTGLESFDQIEITDGISEADTVAISGAYLLYAEMVLKKGADPMSVHSH